MNNKFFITLLFCSALLVAAMTHAEDSQTTNQGHFNTDAGVVGVSKIQGSDNPGNCCSTMMLDKNPNCMAAGSCPQYKGLDNSDGVTTTTMPTSPNGATE